MRSHLFSLTLLATIAVAACSSDEGTSGSAPAATDAAGVTTGVSAPTDTVETVAPTDTPATEPELTELATIAAGPYHVGVTTLTIGAATDRPLTVDVWFPIDDAGAAPPHRYTLAPGIYYESPDAVTADATQMTTDGPFPLVVYSHGSGGLRYIASSYTEAIASHGYIVVAPDHTGNTAIDRLLGAEAEFDLNALNRPNDVEAVIDAMLDPTNIETAGFVAGVDPEAIAVTGHSFGGFTTMALGSGYTNEIGTFAGDPRVDALIPLAPATGDGSGRLLTDADLGAISAPTLVMVGTNDQTTPADPNVTRIWELSGSEPLHRVDLVDAQHQSFTDVCQYQVSLPTLDTEVPEQVMQTIDTQAVEGCSPGDMPIERAQALTNTFAVSFLESVFRDGEMISPDIAVMPDDVIFTTR